MLLASAYKLKHTTPTANCRDPVLLRASGKLKFAMQADGVVPGVTSAPLGGRTEGPTGPQVHQRTRAPARRGLFQPSEQPADLSINAPLTNM